MDFFSPALFDQPQYRKLNASWRIDEAAQLDRLCSAARLSDDAQARIQKHAYTLVEKVRKNRRSGTGIDAFMHEYQLSSQEGVVLMCLAEALLRIPDEETIDKLIRDKIATGDWESHLGKSESLFVNASTWGLMISGRMVGAAGKLEEQNAVSNPDTRKTIFQRLLQRSGEPVIRQAVRQAMRIMGRQFVMGRTIGEALKRARRQQAKGYFYSYDMLGEAARTEADSVRYLQAYLNAINTIGKAAENRGPLQSPGISIKLSALHPRYELAQAERIMRELLPRLLQLAQAAKAVGIGLTIDAEEADRLDMSMALLEAVATDATLSDWDGLGVAVQAYQKRAFDLIDWLATLATRSKRRLMIRLVKGAYWDTEIKRAQERGLDGYPVFTRKACTDVSYLACARKLLAQRELFYPQFATHNAHTVAAVLEMAGDKAGSFEFQRLHGMGQALHEQIIDKVPCRIYAPVGSHEDLLPYLVRRLLENGANTSFVNRIVDDKAPIEEIVSDPLQKLAALPQIPHPRIPLPAAIYPDRVGSRGLELSDVEVLEQLQSSIKEASSKPWQAAPSVAGSISNTTVTATAVYSPADSRQQIGQVIVADTADVQKALDAAPAAARQWERTPVTERAACLERCADLLEAHSSELIAMCIQEGGKTIGDAVAEVREAVDFCRYYAVRARADFTPELLPGPTGEQNQLQLHGRGVFVCISPWNFPLAIFIGQISAALAAGNAVLAKPAEQTPLIAAAAVKLMYQAGIPLPVLQFLPGGAEVGAALVEDSRIAGVAFTGSTETAWAINRSLAARDGAIATLIAETGGQNVMLVDSSALLEQVVADVLYSGFQSAGQRCSALRVLLVQQDIASRLLEMLSGAMAELMVGDPGSLATDIGPIIDQDALQMLQQHAERMDKEATLIHCCKTAEPMAHGTFFPPRLYEIHSLDQLQREVFGPVVHVMRYRASELDAVIDAINNTGYGLTFGIHSRIDTTVRSVVSRISAGNVYVNRNMIGAMVGVQPFGGTGLSGTGPKAGGPHYLQRFATEQTVTVNTAAAGGNASLMSLQEETAAVEQSAQLAPAAQLAPELIAKAAEDAARDKDEFLATLAHELRNPLAAISLGLHVLESATDDPARIAEMTELIQRQSKQLKRLIDDVSDVGRISRGRLRLELKPINIVALLRAAVAEAQTFCDENGVRLSAALPEIEIVVDADRARLAQAVGNVLHNAARFTEHGGSIHITIEREDQLALVRIADTGIGLPADQFEHIFSMFTQVKESPGMRSGGLGIGLALARTIMEMHNGTIEAHSEGRGKGAEFRLRLPVQGTGLN